MILEPCIRLYTLQPFYLIKNDINQGCSSVRDDT